MLQEVASHLKELVESHGWSTVLVLWVQHTNDGVDLKCVTDDGTCTSLYTHNINAHLDSSQTYHADRLTCVLKQESPSPSRKAHAIARYMLCTVRGTGSHNIMRWHANEPQLSIFESFA